MTKEEHTLMIFMFARMNEAVGIITEALKSNDIWNRDDVKAFSHVVHTDDEKLLSYASQARKDYLAFANQLGVIVDVDT